MTNIIHLLKRRFSPKPRQPRPAKPPQLHFGGVPLPRAAEPLGVFVVGSPGSGKTQAINGNLSRIRTRGERVLILDAGGEALSGWWREGDIILNPRDARALPWSPLAELTGDGDAVSVAGGITGEPEENERGEWVSHARDLIAAVLDILHRDPASTNRDLLHWLTIAPRAELAELLTGQPVHRFFERDGERMLASILGIVGARMQPFKILDPGAGRDAFSLREWATDEKSKAWVWFNYRDDQARGLKPLLRAITESAATALLAQETQLGRRIWFVMDEFASVGKVDKLLDLLAKGRKKGGCAIIGTQGITQIDRNWGRENRGTIRNGLQTLVALSAADQETAKWIEDDLGEEVYLIEKRSHSRNDGGGIAAGGTVSTTVSTAYEMVREPVIRAGDIKDLPTRRAILKIAGLSPCLVTIPIASPPAANKPFVSRNLPATCPQPVPAAPAPAEPPPAAEGAQPPIAAVERPEI